MTRKQIDIIISVAAAILLWFYVINIANPPVQVTLRDIPVTVTGEEELAKNKLAPVTTEGYTATVTVSGPRNVVNKIRPEDVKLSADISDLTLGTGTVQIASAAPSGTTVEEIQNPGIEVVVEELATVSKPVEVVLSGATSGREATLLTSTLTQVEVSGAVSRLAQVAAVKVSGDMSGAELDKPEELMLAATPVDEEGKTVSGVRLAHESIGVTAVIYQTKTVPLEVPVEGSVWEGAVLKETEIGRNIVIKGPASRLSQISGITAKAVDIGGIYETTVFDVEPMLPGGVFEADSSEPVQAKFVIEENGKLEFKFNVGDVSVQGLGEGHTVTVTLPEGYSDIVAKVSGPVATLRTLASGDISPMVDAEGRSAGEMTLVLRPSRDITGLTVEYLPSKVNLGIK